MTMNDFLTGLSMFVGTMILVTLWGFAFGYGLRQGRGIDWKVTILHDENGDE
jgi:hypothetical protein